MPVLPQIQLLRRTLDMVQNAAKVSQAAKLQAAIDAAEVEAAHQQQAHGLAPLARPSPKGIGQHQP